TAMDALADTEGFIVVYPDSPDTSWAAGSCCSMYLDGGGGNPNRDDVGFARALVDEISKDACIDSKRIYTTGMSNGGFMTQLLACEAADLFAAAVPVAGMVGVDCKPSRAIPVMDFHGTADMTVPYDDSTMLGSEGVGIPDMMSLWAMRDGCTAG